MKRPSKHRLRQAGGSLERPINLGLEPACGFHSLYEQVGTTHGSTDGSAIAPFGAPNTGLSWPGRYSHSPAEVLDLRDVHALTRLIAALAMER